VQTATSNIIIPDERKHLCFVGVSVVKGAVQNLVNIVDIGRTPNASVVTLNHTPSYGRRIVTANPDKRAVFFFKLHSSAKLIRHRFVLTHFYLTYIITLVSF
jgi:hypothetical protein